MREVDIDETFSDQIIPPYMLTRLSTGECLLPIGCSCINQFQLEYFASSVPDEYRASGSPFRWNITTPEATARLLMEVQNKRRFSLLETPDDIVWDSGWPCSRKIKGLYFWHIAKDVGASNRHEARLLLEDCAVFERFKSKYDRLLDKLFELPRETTFIWSNIQPNLKEAVEMLGLVSWEDFVLTSRHMTDIKRALHALGFEDARCVWICRHEDCAVDEPDSEIHLMHLPRSDEFKGQSGLFDEIYRSLLPGDG